MDSLQADPEQLAAMDPAVRDAIVEAFSQSLSTVFLVGVPFAALALIAVWRMPEHPLRENRAVDDPHFTTDEPRLTSGEASAALA